MHSCYKKKDAGKDEIEVQSDFYIYNNNIEIEIENIFEIRLQTFYINSNILQIFISYYK